MKIILKVLLVLVSAGLPIPALFAQQDILSASFDATGAGGTVSWSVGEVPYSAWTTEFGTITEGVQQPYEIFTMSIIEKFTSAPGCVVFPNPTTGNVTLKFLKNTPNDLTFCIYDMEGTQVSRDTIDSEESCIPMDDLKPAIYFLVILEKNQPIKTYKIIKQ
jgi:hypothetical protein